MTLELNVPPQKTLSIQILKEDIKPVFVEKNEAKARVESVFLSMKKFSVNSYDLKSNWRNRNKEFLI